MDKLNLSKLDLTDSQANEVTQLLAIFLPQTKVWAFGSRVKGNATPRSDLDLVVFSSNQQALAVFQLQHAFEESCLPFSVDVLVWDHLTTSMQQNISAHYAVIQQES
ncbi:MAG: nucleotidyltransferase family protein [Shewanella sp.]